jgi:hypothetical protein
LAPIGSLKQGFFTKTSSQTAPLTPRQPSKDSHAKPKSHRRQKNDGKNQYSECQNCRTSKSNDDSAFWSVEVTEEALKDSSKVLLLVILERESECVIDGALTERYFRGAED